MDVVIGTRMHSVILSSTMGVPVIGIEYEFKIRDYLESIDKRNIYQNSMMLLLSH